MNNIDTSKWRRFKVKELFNIHPTKSYDLNNAQLIDDGTNPVLANSRYNNGVGGYSTLENTEEGNMITFSDTVDANTIFYQKDPFIGYSHVQGLYEIGKYKGKWNEKSLLFFCTVFKKAAKTKGFDYDIKFRRDVALELFVYLPVDSNQDPDWKYMEEYISKIEEKSQCRINNFKSIKGNNTPIDITNWKRFNLYDNNLFVINSGNKFDKSKMTAINPSLNFVGRSSINNGVTCVVDNVDNAIPYEKGTLTIALGGEHLGSCFIQKEDYYTSQNVNVLIPKWNMPHNVKLFISLMIYKESRTYYKAFEDELNRHILTDFSILLPVDNKQLPDWSYMENYINMIIDKSQDKIDLFKKV